MGCSTPPNPNRDHAALVRQVTRLLEEAVRLLLQTGESHTTSMESESIRARDRLAPSRTSALATPPAGAPIEEFNPELCRRQHRRAIYDQFLDLRVLFSDDQWVALEAYYHFGLSQTEIAEALNISRKAVYGRLERAKHTVAAHQAELRREQANLVRNLGEF